jgi:hypothetical protein
VCKQHHLRHQGPREAQKSRSSHYQDKIRLSPNWTMEGSTLQCSQASIRTRQIWAKHLSLLCPLQLTTARRLRPARLQRWTSRYQARTKLCLLRHPALLHLLWSRLVLSHPEAPPALPAVLPMPGFLGHRECHLLDLPHWHQQCLHHLHNQRHPAHLVRLGHRSLQWLDHQWLDLRWLDLGCLARG